MSKASRKNKNAAKPTTLAPRDKAMLIGVPILLLAVPALVLHFSSIRQQRASISKTVEGWRSIYHLSDEQVESIKKIEIDFHGTGSPFSFRPVHKKEETHRHHQEIGGLMAPEDGARFIKVMEKSEGKH
ncbi:MAG: hypothetical protein CJBNEKGG_00671 [Prosthecobacter sp.]|nr:hypothetical protein [Prosthecobacter sp.]